MWYMPKCSDDVCSGLTKTKVTHVGGLKQQNLYCIHEELCETSKPPFHSVFLCAFKTFDSPVALPCVSDVWVMDVVFVGLLIQEVKHVFDRQWQGTAPVGCAEDGLKQIVHKLLQRALKEGQSKTD